MNEVEVFLRLGFLGLGAIMFTLSLSSWVKTREPKMGFAVLGFGTLLAEGAILALGIFCSCAEDLVSTLLLAGMNLIALIFLYLSILKR